MESDSPGPSPADELRQLEQAAVDAAIAPLPVPNWVWPAVAVAGSLFASGYAVGGTAQPILSAVALIGFLGIAVHLSKRHGVVNDLRTQPRELTLLQARLVAETIVLAVVMVVLGKATNPWVSVALAGPIFAVIFYLHDQRYEAKTAEMRAARKS